MNKSLVLRYEILCSHNSLIVSIHWLDSLLNTEILNK